MRYSLHFLLLFVMMTTLNCCLTYNYAKIKSNFSAYNRLTNSYLTSEFEEKWKSYGACYDYDEFAIEVQPTETRYIINKRIKILSREGVKYGTLSLPYFDGSRVDDYAFSIIDENGKRLKINSKDLIKQYENNGGEVVFPNVKEGCVIEMYLDIISGNPLYYYDYWYAYSIPVMKSKFNFTYHRDFTYDYQMYNEDKKIDGFPIFKENISPIKYEDYQSADDFMPPHLSLVLRRAYNQNIINSWDRLAEYWGGQFIDSYKYNYNVKTVADRLTIHTKGDFNKADVLLKWIQENIEVDPSIANRDIDLDNIITSKKSNYYGIQLLYNSMLSAIKIESDIFFTRTKFDGGFDEKFIDPSAIKTPITVVTCDKDSYIGSPNVKGAILGEYSSVYNGQKALSLKLKKVVDVPSPLLENAKTYYSYTFNPQENESKYDVKITYYGYSALIKRNDLYDLTQEDIDEYFQKQFTYRNKDNALESVTFKGLKDRGKPLEVNAIIYNSQNVVEKKGVRLYSLSHLFNRVLGDVKFDRDADFNLENNKTFTNKVEIVKPKGKKVEVKKLIKHIDNEVFELIVSTKEDKDTITIIRVVKQKKVNISAAELKKLENEFTLLNDSRNISISIK